MKKKVYPLLFLTVVLFSCTDNDENLNIEIQIGGDNANVVVYKLDPPIKVTDQISGLIDLNGDEKHDLEFNMVTIPLTTGYGLETTMTKSDGVQVVLSLINNYPDSLSYLTNLNEQQNWSDTSNETMIIKSYQKRNESNVIGNFILYEPKYLGIKMENRYGWVKLEHNNLGELILDEYALVK